MFRRFAPWGWLPLSMVAAHAAAADPPAPLQAAEPAPAPAPADAAEPPSELAPAGPAEPAPAPSDPERQELEAEFQQALGSSDESASAPAPSSPAPAASAPSALRLIDLSLDLLGAAGSSTAEEAELRNLQAGGHDPKNRGFTVQNVELTLSGVVDPYLRGDSNIVLQIDESGETVIELEEAYLTTLDLPFHLQLKAGQFFTAFGRLNPTHPHSWDFVDQPVINTRLFGPDGLRSQGAQLAWLTPLPFFAELTASVQNAHGETATSFRNVPGETIAGRVLIERPVESANDLLYLLRLRSSFDATEELTLVPGLSALFGPNATGTQTRTQIYGADLYAKWKPLINDHGWPFVAWQTEAMLRRYQAAEVVSESGAAVEPSVTLNDYGLYSQLLWGFARPWVAGVRYDYARGQADDTLPDGSYSSENDPLRDQRHRFSVVVSYYPSEFSKLRLQYNYDRSQFLSQADAHSAYLQFEILFGAHGAHKF
ncbi:MAG TPA: hypothetical protein VFS67_03185 [Polyangiaceae bacterium]|nr:hypothetical protein [Polyangiaceae bacterium]